MTSERVNHDASKFYSSLMMAGATVSAAQAEDILFPENLLNKVMVGDARMLPLPDNCAHLIVTSPPYNTGKDYDKNLALSEYLTLLKESITEMYRILVHGGRVVFNIAGLGRKPYIPLYDYTNEFMEDAGFLARGVVIWNKAASVGTSCAWGSFASASNPTLRDVHEFLLVYSKGTFQRDGKGRVSTISRDDFVQWTKSIWTFPTASAKRTGHPAPFPLELPRRCIELYTFLGDVVVDPFMGSGTTAVAARSLHRSFFGVDNDPAYVELANKRLQDAAGG